MPWNFSLLLVLLADSSYYIHYIFFFYSIQSHAFEINLFSCKHLQKSLDIFCDSYGETFDAAFRQFRRDTYDIISMFFDAP